MARSNLPPITLEGRLRNYLDQLLLATLAIGLPVEAHCAAHDESKEGANRALQRLAETLEANGRYSVLVWAMNRELLDIESLTARHPHGDYENWLSVVRSLEANPLEPPQADLLIAYTGSQHMTLNTHWSQPDKHSLIKQILDQGGLSITGRSAYALVISAAAFLKQVLWEKIPGSEALKIQARNGVFITLSGPPNLVKETMLIVKAALEHAEQSDDTPGSAD